MTQPTYFRVKPLWENVQGLDFEKGVVCVIQLSNLWVDHLAGGSGLRDTYLDSRMTNKLTGDARENVHLSRIFEKQNLFVGAKKND